MSKDNLNNNESEFIQRIAQENWVSDEESSSESNSSIEEHA